MTARRTLTPAGATRVCLLAVLSAAASAGLLAAAVLDRAPASVLPLLALVCIGWPVAASWSLPPAIAVLRRPRDLRAFRRHLDRLPEVEHPLGL